MAQHLGALHLSKPSSGRLVHKGKIAMFVATF